MTALVIRRGSGRKLSRHHRVLRVVLAVLAATCLWLIVISAAAGQQARGNQPNFPAGKLPDDFNPQKFIEAFLGKPASDLQNNAQLDKIEIAPREETRLGQQLLGDLKERLAAQKKSLTDRGQDVQYVAQLAALIQPRMQQAERYKKLQIHVANLGSPNAYALPGGHLIIAREMLDQAGCEAALVCVIGHELSHLDRGHLLRRAKQWKLAQENLTKPPKEFSFDAMASKFGQMQQLFRLPFNPNQEAEGDRDGITWAYHAGYDPRAVEQVYEAMQAAGATPSDLLPAFLRTHPLTADRRDALRATYTQLQTATPTVKLYLGRENLRLRIARQQQVFPE